MSEKAILPAVIPVAAYLVGSIPFGLLVGYLRGVDIRKQGSGNIGATNVSRVLGRKWGLLVFALDVMKGAVPTAVAAWAMARYGESIGWPASARTLFVMVVQACCVFGHNWPIYLGFKGGKGVATSLGILLGYWPYLTLPGLVGLGTWVLVLLASRYVSAASIVAASLFPFYVIAFGVWQRWPVSTTAMLAVFSAVMASLIVVRHRSNIKRLLAGTEPKMGRKAGNGSGEETRRRGDTGTRGRGETEGLRTEDWGLSNGNGNDRTEDWGLSNGNGRHRERDTRRNGNGDNYTHRLRSGLAPSGGARFARPQTARAWHPAE